MEPHQDSLRLILLFFDVPDTNFFIFPYSFSVIVNLTVEGGLKSKTVRKQTPLKVAKTREF